MREFDDGMSTTKVSLSRPWMYRGRIVSGRGLGRRLGAPTYNVPLVDTTIPHGIFAGFVLIKNELYPAVIHAGARPTVGDMTPIVEAHLIGKIPAISPRIITVLGIVFIRSIRNFRTRLLLKKAITKDVQMARKWFDFL